jgi:hypothetical protein
VTSFSIPTPNGSLIFGQGAGNCIVNGCKVKGGGLMNVVVLRVGQDDAQFNVCGGHMAQAIATMLQENE